ncbi:PAS domain S-box protein [bacterium]|nr:PAS domain S-box protein [bacterium]
MDPRQDDPAAPYAITSAIARPALVVASGGRIASANDGFVRLVGRTIEELRARTLAGALPESVATAITGAVDAARADGTGRAHATLDGVPWRIQAQKLADGACLVVARPEGHGMVVAFPADRLDRRILDFAPDIVYVTDSKGRLVYGNARVEETSGYTIEELMHRRVSETVHPEDLRRFREILPHAREGRAGRIEGLRFYAKNGRVVRLDVSWGPLRDNTGTFVGLIGFCRDVTRRYLLERRLTRSRNLEMMRQLSEAIAGDFRNIITGIKGNLSLLRAQLDSPAVSVLETLARLADSAERAEDLTGQLLACTRSARGAPRPTDLSALVRAVAGRFSGYGSEGLVLDLRLADDLPPVYIDPVFGERLIANLLQNSWEAMPDGGVIEIRTMRQFAGQRQGEAAFGDFVRLIVADDGIGIDTRDLPHVFEPFFTTKSARRGLGLTAVRSIVENLGGTVRVDSNPGEGTTMTVDLPAIEAMALPAPAASGQAPARILIVDDDAIVRDLCQAALASVGASCVLASTGAEATRVFAERPTEFDVVLLDLVLPDMTGEDVFRRIRARRPDIVVVVSSGFRDVQDRMKAQGLFDDNTRVLPKPFTIEQLLSAVPVKVDRHAGDAERRKTPPPPDKSE